MKVILTNICGGELVCDLATKGKTLRLQNKESITVEESEMTPHIKTLNKKGLLLVEYKESRVKKESKKKNGVDENIDTQTKKED